MGLLNDTWYLDRIKGKITKLKTCCTIDKKNGQKLCPLNIDKPIFYYFSHYIIMCFEQEG